MDKKFKFERWQLVAILMAIYDILAVNISYLFTLWIRFDFRFRMIPKWYMGAWRSFAPIYTIFCIVVFALLHMYRSIWRFASFSELGRVFLSSVITGVFHFVIMSRFYEKMPMTYYVFGAILQFFAVLAVRFSYPLISFALKTIRETAKDRIMLVGAGFAGQLLLRDLNGSSGAHGRVVCIIDDDPNKRKRYMDGIQIVGNRDEIPENVVKYKVNKIYVAIPTATEEQHREILKICRTTGCELKTLPSSYQRPMGEVNVGSMRDVLEEESFE